MQQRSKFKNVYLFDQTREISHKPSSPSDFSNHGVATPSRLRKPEHLLKMFKGDYLVFETDEKHSIFSLIRMFNPA